VTRVAGVQGALDSAKKIGIPPALRRDWERLELVVGEFDYKEASEIVNNLIARLG
jgi:hypothetical protein